MPKSRRSARLRGIQAPDIPLSDRFGFRASAVQTTAAEVAAAAGVVAATAEVVVAKSSPRRRRWRKGVLAETYDVVLQPTEPEASCSEDTLFNELTQEDPEMASSMSCSEDSLFNELTQDVPDVQPMEGDETPTWIRDAEEEEAGAETEEEDKTGNEADEGVQEEEDDDECFFIDTEGECFWLDDDFPDSDHEFLRW